MYLLPLIGVGLLSDWKPRPILWSAGFVLSNGILLSIIVNGSNTVLSSYAPGKVDTGLVYIFWPAVFSDITHSLALGTCYLVLFTIGCLGILFVGYVISKNKKGLLILLLLISLLALRDQVVEHIGSEDSYSGYSGFVELTMKNYKKGTCVGFSDKLTDYESERLNYIKFYLHEYSVERMNSTEWLDKCDGPYLTYDVKFVDGLNNVKIIAKDRLSGLYIIMRNKNVSSIKLSRKLDYSEYTMSNRYGCKVEGCLDWDASSGDPSLTQVGEYQNGALHTTGREGYLFMGPKVAVDEGTYRIKMKLHISKPDTISRLKITSDNGKVIHRLVIFDKTSDNPEYIFQLGKAVNDLQIMLYAGEGADITLSSYQGTEISRSDLNN
jgi:hypothetical protein